MKKHAFIISLLLACAESGFSQYQRSYGTPSAETGRSITRAVDNGYVIAGQTSYPILGSVDAYLQRTDNNGALLWGRVYGGTQPDYFTSVKRNNYYPANSPVSHIAAGYTSSFSIGAAGTQDAYLVGVDVAGNPLFSRVYGGTATDRAHSVQSIRDVIDGPGFIFVGETNSFGLAGNLAGVNVYVVRTDLAGNQKDAVVLGTASDDFGYSIEQTQDGGYIIAGYTTARASVNDVSPNPNILVIKLDAKLNIVWNRIIGGPKPVSDIAYSVKEYTNGLQRGYILTGYTENYGAGYSDAFLLTLDLNGDLVWFRTYGEARWEQGRSVLQTKSPNGAVEFIVTGYGASYSDTYDAYTFKTDVSGNLLWSKIYGGTNADFSYEIIHNHLAGPGYATAGATGSFAANGSQDVYLVSTNNVGNANTNCEKYVVQKTARYLPYLIKGLASQKITGTKYIVGQVKQIPLEVHGCIGIGGFREEEIAENQGIESTDEITLQPNPVSNSLLSVTTPANFSEGTLKVLDMEGKKVKEEKVLGNRQEINVQDLKPGIYMLHLTSMDGATKYSKFIKQ